MRGHSLARWAAAFCVVLAGALPLSATSQDMAPHVAAGQAFEGLRAAHPERMPRLAEPEAAEALRTLADAATFLPAQGSVDLPTLSDACDRAQAAVVAYQTFGALQNGQLVASAVVNNAATYQDELALLQPFVARCIARQVPLAESMLRQMDPRTLAQLRLGGLRRGQATILQLYASLATALPDARIRPAVVDALLGALAETAPVHVRALAVAARAAPRDLAQGQAPQGGPRQAKWQRIAAAMADTRCDALCDLAARGGR